MTLYFKDGTNSGTVFSAGVSLQANPTDSALINVCDSGNGVIGGTPVSNLQYFTIA